VYSYKDIDLTLVSATCSSSAIVTISPGELEGLYMVEPRWLLLGLKWRALKLLSAPLHFFFLLSFFSSNASVFNRKTVERLPSHDSDVCPARSAIQQRLEAFIWVRVTTNDKFVFYQTSSSDMKPLGVS
jgi:hypothetical protein